MSSQLKGPEVVLPVGGDAICENNEACIGSVQVATEALKAPNTDHVTPIKGRLMAVSANQDMPSIPALAEEAVAKNVNPVAHSGPKQFDSLEYISKLQERQLEFAGNPIKYAQDRIAAIEEALRLGSLKQDSDAALVLSHTKIQLSKVAQSPEAEKILQSVLRQSPLALRLSVSQEWMDASGISLEEQKRLSLTFLGAVYFYAAQALSQAGQGPMQYAAIAFGGIEHNAKGWSVDDTAGSVEYFLDVQKFTRVLFLKERYANSRRFGDSVCPNTPSSSAFLCGMLIPCLQGIRDSFFHKVLDSLPFLRSYIPRDQRWTSNLAFDESAWPQKGNALRPEQRRVLNSVLSLCPDIEIPDEFWGNEPRKNKGCVCEDLSYDDLISFFDRASYDKASLEKVLDLIENGTVTGSPSIRTENWPCLNEDSAFKASVNKLPPLLLLPALLGLGKEQRAEFSSSIYPDTHKSSELSTEKELIAFCCRWAKFGPSTSENLNLFNQVCSQNSDFYRVLNKVFFNDVLSLNSESNEKLRYLIGEKLLSAPAEVTKGQIDLNAVGRESVGLVLGRKDLWTHSTAQIIAQYGSKEEVKAAIAHLACKDKSVTSFRGSIESLLDRLHAEFPDSADYMRELSRYFDVGGSVVLKQNGSRVVLRDTPAQERLSIFDLPEDALIKVAGRLSDKGAFIEQMVDNLIAIYKGSLLLGQWNDRFENPPFFDKATKLLKCVKTAADSNSLQLKHVEGLLEMAVYKKDGGQEAYYKGALSRGAQAILSKVRLSSEDDYETILNALYSENKDFIEVGKKLLLAEKVDNAARLSLWLEKKINAEVEMNQEAAVLKAELEVQRLLVSLADDVAAQSPSYKQIKEKAIANIGQLFLATNK